MKKLIIQITAGKGPLECCMVVARVQDLMLKQASARDLNLSVIENKKGEVNGTLLSSTLLLQGDDIADFVSEWDGTIQWIAQSPYRPFHKRKNWFVGVGIFGVDENIKFNPNDVKFETMRASGPGGQSVNKVETAVRGIYTPSGIQVVVMDSRSQLQNKKLCMERLEAWLMSLQAEKQIAQMESQWMAHHAFERGNATMVIRAKL